MKGSAMTGEEFAAARATLGLSVEDIAAELDIPLHSVEAMEAGAIRVPGRVAKDLAFRAALRQRQAVLEASGLPECPTAAALERAATGAEGESAVGLFEKLTAHSASCPVCKARRDYLDSHAPALPEYPMPLWIRGIGWVERQLGRMPRFLRPPEGDAGEGRRIGVFTAAGFSLLAIGIAVIAAISSALGHASDPGWWREPVSIAVLAPMGYFVGFFLAGWAFDVTRPIRHRLIGYVIRGATAAAAIYGSMGLIVPAIDHTTHLRDWPIIVGIIAVLGAVGGAVLWVVHRVKGKLPGRAS